MKNLFLAFSDECYGLIHSISAITVLVLGVVFYSLLYPLPYRHQSPQKLPVLVVDQDRSTSSRTLLRLIDSTEGARVGAVVSDVPTALRDLRDGAGSAVLVIPSDFERNLLRGGRSILPLYCDAGYLLPYRVVFKGISLAAENMGAGVRIQRFQAAGMPELPAQALQLRGQMSIRTLYNPAGSYALNTIPAVFVLILQQTLLIGSAILAGRQFRHPETVSGDVSSPFYLLGRMLFLACLYLVHALYYLWLLPVFYDLPRVSGAGSLIIFLLPFFLACAAAGSAFGRLVSKPEYVLIAALPCSLPFLFLSGFAWPAEAMPRLLQHVAQALPSTPAINGYLLMSDRNATLRDILPLWLQLWGLALFFFALAWGALRLHAARNKS